MTKPDIASKAPCEVELQEGKKYFYCTCGKSEKQPFCDGAHKGTDFRPQIFEVEKSCKKWLCQCKHSKNNPYCDGSHKAL